MGTYVKEFFIYKKNCSNKIPKAQILTKEDKKLIDDLKLNIQI